MVISRGAPLAGALLLAAGAAAGPARAADPVVLKLGTLAPAGSAWHELLQELARRWEVESGGRVRLRVYPGGVQGSEGEMIRKLEIGQLQAVAITDIGMHDILPEPQALSTPMLFDDAAELGCTLDRVAAPLAAALARHGYVVLQWSRVGAASFFCTGPVATPDALGARRLFAWEGDPATVDAWRAIGFRPVVLSSTDLLPALETGMVDCVGNVPLYMLTTGAFQKARYLVDLPWSWLLAGTLVRADAWERVPPELRPRLAAIARELGLRIDQAVRRLDEEAVAAMRRRGLQLVEVDRAAWRDRLVRSWPALRGAAVPAPFFDEVVAARDACRAAAAR